METTDKSTPSNTEVTDTSSDVSLRDTSASEPQKEALEPANALDEADVTDEPAEDNELIFGKFKTMEDARKGYKEAERAITKVADLEKQLNQYKYLSETYEQDGIARRQGYADRLDMALTSDVRKHELDNYALAAGYTLSPQEHNYQVHAYEHQMLMPYQADRHNPDAAQYHLVHRFRKDTYTD